MMSSTDREIGKKSQRDDMLLLKNRRPFGDRLRVLVWWVLFILQQIVADAFASHKRYC